MPADYYTRILSGRKMNVFVSESGWTSQSLTKISVVSSPVLQQKWIKKQDTLLQNAKAIAWFQLTFTDLSLTAFPAEADELYPFAFMGMVDTSFVEKPSYAAWKTIYAKKFQE